MKNRLLRLWNLFKTPKRFEDDVEAEALVTVFHRSPWLEQISLLTTLLDIVAVILFFIGHKEGPIFFAIAGGLSLVSGGLLWNAGVKRWAARDFLAGSVALIVAVVAHWNS